MKTTNWNVVKNAPSAGSALILTVVLTSMLAIVGVLFVMMARVDKVATSAISENRELDLAVETVIAKISQELVLDVPGVAGQEYYDYPGPQDEWLASLEPNSNMMWQQISDVYKKFVPSILQPAIVPDYQLPLQVRDSNGFLVYPADADGDGVTESAWVKLPDITSSKGEPIFAAIRVIDNGAMLNVNTGFKFDPNVEDANRIDGSSQTQINLMALSWRLGRSAYDPCDETDLLEARANPSLGLNPFDLYQYEQNVIWRYFQPNGPYTPFDISDELEFRYRYLLNHTGIDTRLEELGSANGRSWEFRRGAFSTPAQAGDLGEWFMTAFDGGGFDPNYAYRHIGTTYNMDRIIDPYGDKMININRVIDANIIYDRLLRSNQPLVADASTRMKYAQLAANMVDFIDDDAMVTVFGPNDPLNPNIYYGLDAQPFISEIGIIISSSGSPDKSKPPIPMDPADSSFAVELYNPFDCNIPLSDFELELVNRRLGSDIRIITFNPGDTIYANSCFVISNRPLDFGLNPANANVIVRPGLILFTVPDKSKPPVPSGQFGDTYDLFLKRRVDVTGTMIYVDKQMVYEFAQATQGIRLYLGRCIRDWHVIYQTPDLVASHSLGWPDLSINPFSLHRFSFFMPNPLRPRARFITVGDIPRILTLGHSTTRDSTIGEKLQLFYNEADVRLDLTNPYHMNVFQYLTVFDPNSDNIDNDVDSLIDVADISSPEVQVPGRININTAPWYVLAQLPWVSAHTPNYELAKAMVAYRDKAFLSGGPDYTARLGAPGFGSIGELNLVDAGMNNFNIGAYALDGAGVDLPDFPDLTVDGPDLGDGVPNDFEERDVIFSRISNLVTVRSDVFTAYILVRIGADGPQKRVIAILDRSGVNKTNVSSPDGKVRIVALHYVPDAK